MLLEELELLEELLDELELELLLEDELLEDELPGSPPGFAAPEEELPGPGVGSSIGPPVTRTLLPPQAVKITVNNKEEAHRNHREGMN